MHLVTILFECILLKKLGTFEQFFFFFNSGLNPILSGALLMILCL